MPTTRDEFVDKVGKQLEEINEEIKKFEQKAEESGEKAMAEFDANVDKLRAQSKQMQAKLDELRAASEDHWDRMIEEARKYRDAFVHSLNYFRSQIK